MRRFLRNRRGFTFVELMVVVVILGILATIAIQKMVGRVEQAKRTAAKVQIKNFENALKLFYLDNGFYPSTEQGLEALVEKPTIGRIPENWKEGGYLEGGQVPLDPWGNEYVYISPGIYNKDYDIWSRGSDGEDGGEGDAADIQSWNLQ